MGGHKNRHVGYRKDNKEYKLSNGRSTEYSKKELEEAWPVEIETLKNIQEGKVEMETVTTDELLKELKELENDD